MPVSTCAFSAVKATTPCQHWRWWRSFTSKYDTGFILRALSRVRVHMRLAAAVCPPPLPAFGLADVDDIKYVINYDYPNNSEDYVHRIGRTGRRDKRGTAYTFFTPQNAAKARDLIKVLEEAGQQVPQSLRDLQGRGGSSNSRGRWGGSSGGGMKRGYSGGDDYGGKKGRYENGGGYGGGGGRW
nr:DNA RNA helicase domain containing protein [Haemonchus contortus]